VEKHSTSFATDGDVFWSGRCEMSCKRHGRRNAEGNLPLLFWRAAVDITRC